MNIIHDTQEKKKSLGSIKQQQSGSDAGANIMQSIMGCIAAYRACQKFFFFFFQRTLRPSIMVSWSELEQVSMDMERSE